MAFDARSRRPQLSLFSLDVMMARFSSTDWVLLAVAALFVVLGFVTVAQPDELTLLYRQFPAGVQRPMSRFELLSPSTVRVYGIIAIAIGFGLAVSLFGMSRKT